MASPPRSSVIVIGAGIAGVAASKTLESSGFKVTLLESSGRIGGRIYTDTESFGVPVDLGASWIHGASPLQNPIAGIAVELNLATHETSAAGSPLYDHTVQRGFQLYTSSAARIEPETVRRFDRWLQSVLEREKKRDDYTLAATVEDMVRRIVRESGIGGSVYEQLLNFYVCRIEGWFAAEAGEISTKSWLEEEFYEGGHTMLREGYSPLLASLAKRIEDIRLNHRVISIAVDDYRGVRIRCENGASLDADAVVLAVPLGVLQKNVIRFEPELPEWKREAISGLEVGHQNKIGLLFDSVFWPEDAEFLGLAGGTPRGCSYFLCMYRAVRRPVLVYMPVGDLAREIELLSDDLATEFAMERLREMIPSAPAPAASIVTRWSTDPNFMGCYSNDKSPEGSDLHPRMGMAVSERLHFAGEACSAEFSSTVHGAYQSGVDAARCIADSFRHRTNRYGGEGAEHQHQQQSLNSGGLSNRHVPIVPCNLAAHLLDSASPGLKEISQLQI